MVYQHGKDCQYQGTACYAKVFKVIHTLYYNYNSEAKLHIFIFKFDHRHFALK